MSNHRVTLTRNTMDQCWADTRVSGEMLVYGSTNDMQRHGVVEKVNEVMWIVSLDGICQSFAK